MKYFLWYFCFLVLFSCSLENENLIIKYERKLEYRNNYLKIICEISNFEISKGGYGLDTVFNHYINSQIKVVNLTDTPKVINLNKLFLYINNEEIGEINHPKGFGSRMITDTVIDANGVYTDEIYWFLVNRYIIPDSVKTIRIVYKDD